jgi:hypothetical protein
MERCWICGNNADSQEHKFKASDLRRLYGKNYANRDMHYHLDEEETKIESFKSKELLFPKVICTLCNGTRTQPHDEAYDKFVKYVEGNFEILLQSQLIDLENIYGKNWITEKANLLRYVAKHAGCKIVTGDKIYDLADLSNFILGESNTKELKVHFVLNEGMYQFIKQVNTTDNYGHIFNGATKCFQVGIYDAFGGWISYQWISIIWVVSKGTRITNDPLVKEELLEVEYLKDCDSFGDMNLQEVMLNIEHNGSMTLDEEVEYFKGLIL